MIEVVTEDPRWDALPLQDTADKALVAALDHLGLSRDGFEIAVLGCDDARIAELNGDFRDKPTPTNVLSWPFEDLAPEQAGAVPDAPEADELGDIAIAYGICQQEAAELGRPFAAHVSHLLVHGLLHLLGYDHIRDADATLMERIEGEILGKLGWPDPYIGN